MSINIGGTNYGAYVVDANGDAIPYSTYKGDGTLIHEHSVVYEDYERSNPLADYTTGSDRYDVITTNPYSGSNHVRYAEGFPRIEHMTRTTHEVDPPTWGDTVRVPFLLTTSTSSIGGNCRFRPHVLAAGGHDNCVEMHLELADDEINLFHLVNGNYENMEVDTSINGPLAADTYYFAEIDIPSSTSGTFTARVLETDGTSLGSVSGSLSSSSSNLGTDYGMWMQNPDSNTDIYVDYWHRYDG